jgi:hypothetical protein
MPDISIATAVELQFSIHQKEISHGRLGAMVAVI